MKELTKKLQQFIDKEVEIKVLEIKGNAKDYKDFINDFTETLNHLERSGRDLIEDCKSDKLKFSEAEAEGFLRAIITVKNQFQNDFKYYK